VAGLRGQRLRFHANAEWTDHELSQFSHSLAARPAREQGDRCLVSVVGQALTRFDDRLDDREIGMGLTPPRFECRWELEGQLPAAMKEIGGQEAIRLFRLQHPQEPRPVDAIPIEIHEQAQVVQPRRARRQNRTAMSDGVVHQPV